MILIAIAGLLGLAATAGALHKMTVNALPLFIGLTGGFFALKNGSGIGISFLATFAIAVLTRAIIKALAQPQLPTLVQLIAKATLAIPAAVAAWFIVSGMMNALDSGPVFASISSMIAGLIMAAQAWRSCDQAD
jgi:hypothetical protein